MGAARPTAQAQTGGRRGRLLRWVERTHPLLGAEKAASECSVRESSSVSVQGAGHEALFPGQSHRAAEPPEGYAPTPWVQPNDPTVIIYIILFEYSKSKS